MNRRIVFRMTGALVATFGASMLPSLAVALWYADASRLPLAASTLLTVGAGLAMFRFNRERSSEMFRLEANAIVALGWLMSAFAGALPFAFWGGKGFATFPDAFFESMSGLTTTGASILTDIEAVPKGLLFWRAWLHWIGGLGIVMLSIAILPYLGSGGRKLAMSEATGPVKEGLTPRIRDTGRLLLTLYLGYTAAETILLMLCGMTPFDAVCHTFATVATGGFSTKNSSVAHYDSLAIEIVIVSFMAIASTNFALAWAAFQGKPKELLNNTEFRAFVCVLVLSTTLIATILVRRGGYESVGRATRDAVFAAATVQTCTGFGTTDFAVWPVEAQAVLFFALFVGGCAGSTAGGLKIVRFVLLFKMLRATVLRFQRPHRVQQIKMDGVAVSTQTQADVLMLFFLWLATWAVGSLLLLIVEEGAADIPTAFSAVATCMSNTGPGLGLVGPTANYGFMEPFSKLLLSGLMLLGRIEFFAILTVLSPVFWLPRR